MQGKAKTKVALSTGQLVKDELFTLFEAVGALEVRLHPYERPIHM